MPSTGQPPPPKVNIAIEIKTLVEVSDNGYLGIEASVADHIRQAEEQVGRWRWLVEKGAGTTPDPQPIGVRTKVIGVTILPQEKSE